MSREEFLAIQQERLRNADQLSVVMIAGLFALSLAVMIANYYSVRKWEKKAAEERDRAEAIAFIDPLTKVKSKAAFALNEKDYDGLIAEGAITDFAVVVCDVNGLKKINDTLGHKAGDEYDLMLEITESAYTEDSEQVLSTARELCGMGMGFRIEMDDFGTGYSSLEMLSHLPIDVLKLDISFIRNAFGETRDVRMIELIIDIADYLHVPVVAEGVETEEQYMALKALGCDYVQGYYFSRPVPPADFDRFLIERGEQGVEIAPVVKRTYMSISKALTSDYENIYYVDVASNHYLEFFSGKNGDLEIRPGGTDFFGEVLVKILEDVSGEDAKTVGDALSKSNLIRCAGEDVKFTITFKRMKGGVLKEYTLQTIKTKNDDKHHIVIGVKGKR